MVGRYNIISINIQPQNCKHSLAHPTASSFGAKPQKRFAKTDQLHPDKKQKLMNK